MESDYDIRVDYDDTPDAVAEKFIVALKKIGVIVEDVTADPEVPSLFYKIRKG